MPELRPRGNTDVCVRCRKKFMPGDRVHMVHIVQSTGPNPENLREMGAWLTGEFELVHDDCRNPELKRDVTVI